MSVFKGVFKGVHCSWSRRVLAGVKIGPKKS